LCTNCVLKHVVEIKIEGRIEVTGIGGRRSNKLVDDLEEKKGYWKLTQEALDRTLEEAVDLLQDRLQNE
jgi:hypothetical protein